MANETVSFDYSLYQANCSFSDVEEELKTLLHQMKNSLIA